MRRELVDRYRGRWVAANKDGDVVMATDELDALLTAVEAVRPRPDLVVQRIPEADAPVFIGLD